MKTQSIRLDVLTIVLALIGLSVFAAAHLEEARQELLAERSELERKIELLTIEQQRLSDIKNNLEQQRDELAEKNANMRAELFMPETDW